MQRLEEFEAAIHEAMVSWPSPGVSIGILKDDAWIYRKAFGHADIEQNIPLTLETRFPLASVTKSLTALSVALLVDEGRLQWDVPVRTWLPDFALADDYATQHATLRDLLAHRTGLACHGLAFWNQDLSHGELISRLRHLPASSSFRERFQYTNHLYKVAAGLVEQVSGQRWEDFVQQRILHPLGMLESSVEADAQLSATVPAQGYRVLRHEDGSLRQFEPAAALARMRISGGAGALYSTLSDMGQWLRLQLGGGICNGVPLVSPASLQTLHSPQMQMPLDHALPGIRMLASGLGWRLRPHAGGTLIDHGGNTLGHSVVVGFRPESGIGVVVLCNAAYSTLPHVLLRTAVDHALQLPDQDWNARFLAQAAAERRPPEHNAPAEAVPPAHTLADYVGCYADPAYGRVEVRLHGEQLQARMPGVTWSELHHCSGELFEWHWAAWPMRLKLRFQMSAEEQVCALAIPFEPAVADTVFVREAVDAAGSTLAAPV